MSTLAEVNQVIDDIIESTFLIDRSEFDDEVEFGPDGLDAESLDIVEVAEFVEDETGVHIPDEDLEEMETIGDVKQYVGERLE